MIFYRNPRSISEAQVRQALEECDYDIKAACAKLEMGGSTLRARIKKYGIKLRPTGRVRSIRSYYQRIGVNFQ